MPQLFSFAVSFFLTFTLNLSTIHAATLTGHIVDADTKQPLPARLYVQNLDDQSWHHATSPAGTAVNYDKTRGDTSTEIHTTLSAHPFQLDLPPGKYKITALHGKDYLPATQNISFNGGNINVAINLPLKRFTNAPAQHYYSGDTHTHRPIPDLPNIIQAEDLNVALPLTYWVRRAYDKPVQNNITEAPKNFDLITVDPTHVIYPLNTEYEPNSIDGKRHQLGGVFVLNHTKPLNLTVPPMKLVADEARAQGALLDLDKHSWAWSLMLVPIMDIDLYPLSNNHVWRTNFGFNTWTTNTVPDYLPLESDERGFTEDAWLTFGHQVYYAFLNCGFRMRPTAGTASGVHPVPLGFSRVYAHLPNGFDYDDWFTALDKGQTFVTTGPMLYTTFNDGPPGQTFTPKKQLDLHIKATLDSANPITSIKIIRNGDIARELVPTNTKTLAGAYQTNIDQTFNVTTSGWFALRCTETLPNGRTRFAHTAPVFVDIPNKPLLPKKREVQYLINRMQWEIKNNTGVLKPEHNDEYRKALKIYNSLLKTAR